MSPKDKGLQRQHSQGTLQRQSTLDMNKMFGSTTSLKEQIEQLDVMLTNHEKRYLLYVERGDTASVKHIIEKGIKLERRRPGSFNLNCRDPLGRSCLHIALEQENLKMIEMLLEEGIRTGDALLFAIEEKYVEGVETLLEYEEQIHMAGDPYSWENISPAKTTYPEGLTPMMMAAHVDHYEILKLLLQRGAVIQPPHPLKCECDECILGNERDGLRFSLTRMNKYRALSSPSYICLTSEDPFSTAITLAEELKCLAVIEIEFREEYIKLKMKVRNFAENLIKEVRSMRELTIIVNFDPEGEAWEKGQPMHLAKLVEATSFRQREFVAHASIQHLLEKMWFEGLVGFKRLDPLAQMQKGVGIACMFPIYCLASLYAPWTSVAKQTKSPIVRFLIQAGCYMCFLTVLVIACLQLEQPIIRIVKSWFNIPHVVDPLSHPLTYMEMIIILFVFGYVWADVKKIYKHGLSDFVMDAWNIISFVNNFFFMTWMFLRLAGLVREFIMHAPEFTVKRQYWTNFDHRLIAEGLFAAANVVSFMKLVQWFTLSSFTGPLALSVGRMVFEIVKFLTLYMITLTAFMCGITVVMKEYSHYEEAVCYSGPDGTMNPHHEDACHRWRRFTNLWESSQSMFWTTFGFINLHDFEIHGVGPFTRVWVLSMFGSYNVCNVIVLLNLLIAMLSSTYEKIMADVDTHWKFARAELWMKYFFKLTDLPSPFNMLPGFPEKKGLTRSNSSRYRRNKKAVNKYMAVIKLLIKRFITTKHKKDDIAPVTTDNFTELRNDIHAFKYAVHDILKINGWKLNTGDKQNITNRRQAARERKINQDFRVGVVSDGVDLGTLVKQMIDEKKAQKSNKKIKSRGVGSSCDQIGTSANKLKQSCFSLQGIASDNPHWKMVKFYQVRGVFTDGQINKRVLDVSKKRKERLKSQTTLDRGDSIEGSLATLRRSVVSLNALSAFDDGVDSDGQ